MQGHTDIVLPKIQMAFACEGISQDALQRVSFNTIVDEMNAHSFPSKTLQLYVVFGMQLDVPSDAPEVFSKVKIAIEGPNNQKILEQSFPDITFTSERYNVRLIAGFSGLTWPAPGKYLLKLVAGNINMASFSILLKHAVSLTPAPGGMEHSS